MEQQLNRLEALLYDIEDQLAIIVRLLNTYNAYTLTNQQQTTELANRRRVALERHRLQWELQNRQTSTVRPPSEEGEDEIG